MLKCALLLAIITLCNSERAPLYKYRYETEDVMKTAASSVPVHGYHLVEGGYYPESRIRNLGGYQAGFGRGLSGFKNGFSGRFSPSYQFGGNFGSIGGGFPHGYGGEYIDRNNYGDGKKHLTDESYENSGGKSQEQRLQGQEGYNQGKIALRNNKGDSGYYRGEEGDKKVYEDGKSYNGAQKFNQEGQNADQNKRKSGHKKGHVIKGFKTSHHKDESGKTEEYFDEENDEGDNYNFNGKSGGFAENSQSGYKGGHENGKFNSGENKKEGHYDNIHVVDNSNADKGEYGQKKVFEKGQTYGINNGIGEHSLLGHQESNRYYKHHIPFYTQH